MIVCVIGLGEVGLSTAKYIIDKKLDVWGYDIDSEAVHRARKAGIPKASEVWDHIPKADVYLVCVSTLLKAEVPDLSAVVDACKKISRGIAPSGFPLVSVESTITPGLSRRLFGDEFNKRVRLVHAPHRYWSEEPIKHGVKQLRVIGGVDSESLHMGLEFYWKTLGIPMHAVSSIEVAEMSKIAENAHRYVQIAFAEELRMVCENLGLKFNEVRDACNTKWNTKILDARDGIKGHCIPKDTHYLASLTTYNQLLTCAFDVDKEYSRWLKLRS